MNMLVKFRRITSLLFAVAAGSLLLAGDTHPVNQGYWVDPDTRLMWSAADNGSGLSRRQALRYCQASTLGGFKDWTLPTIEQLQGLLGREENHGGFRLRAPVRLTGWQWSSSAGQQEGEGWVFDFGDGGRASVAAGDSGLNRALCVRRP